MEVEGRKGEEDEENAQPGGCSGQTARPSGIINPLDVCLQSEISQNSPRGVLVGAVGPRHQASAGLG